MKTYVFLAILAILSSCEQRNIAPTMKLGMSCLDGRIVYIFSSYDKGYIEGETHGWLLSEDYGIGTWGCLVPNYTKFTTNGKDNTALIVDNCPNTSAAYKCYIKGWWLPSIQEWQYIYKSGIRLDDGPYWSSNKTSSSTAAYFNPVKGTSGNESLTQTFKIIGLKQF